MSQRISEIVAELRNGTFEIFPLPVNESFLQELLTDIFIYNWNVIHFGVSVRGGRRMLLIKVALLDSCLTVDFGNWYFHD